MQKNLATMGPQFNKCTYLLNKQVLEYSGSKNFDSLPDLKKALIAEYIDDLSKSLIDIRYMYCRVLTLQNIHNLDLFDLKTELSVFAGDVQSIKFDLDIIDDLVHLNHNFKKEIAILFKNVLKEIRKLIGITDKYIELSAGYSEENIYDDDDEDDICDDFVVGADGNLDRLNASEEDDEEEDDE